MAIMAGESQTHSLTPQKDNPQSQLYLLYLLLTVRSYFSWSQDSQPLMKLIPPLGLP